MSGTVVLLVLIMTVVIVIALMALVTGTVAVKKASGRQTVIARCGGWVSAWLIDTGIWPAVPHRKLVSGLVMISVVVITLAIALTVNAPVVTVVLMVKYGTRDDNGRRR